MFTSEIFITKKPRSETLGKYISFYYFHEIEEPNQIKKIVYYPNLINAITIYKNSELYFEDNISKAFPKENTYGFFYGGILKKLRIAEMHSPFRKIAVAFEPLGINHFIDKPISELLKLDENLEFNYFKNSIVPVLDQVHETKIFDEKIKLLDDFFLSKLNNFQDEILEKSIEIIQKNQSKLKVSDVSEILNISQKTLNRKFQKHLNCSVKEYLEVSQFRKTFNHFLSENSSEKLTDLVYQFDYYDQSEFIRQFKKITGINPKKLFQNVEHFGDEDLFWGK